MSFDEFIALHNGKALDWDGYFGPQCMDLMHFYIVDVLGLSGGLFAAPTAYQAYQGANDNRFDKIDNTPAGVPQKGDIVFWNTSIGSAGHVAVFISGDNNNFVSFDQNWPTGSLCHEQAHDYKGVAGWLHAKNTPQNTQIVLDEIRKARDANWDLYQGEVAKNNDLTKELQDTQKTLQELREAFDKQTTADADLGTQLLDVSHERDQLKGDFDAVASALKVSPVLKDVLAAILLLQQPVEEQVKPLQKHALSLQEALDAFITNKPYKSLIDRIKKFLNI